MDIISRERDKRKNNKINISFAADCRPYFGSKTFRNFASGGTFSLNQTQPFGQIIQQVKTQMRGLDKAFFQETINSLQLMQKQGEGLSTNEQKEIAQHVHHYNLSVMTTIFSNIGLVKFPPSITGKVKNMEFSISQDGNPYTFCAISVNDTLTMTITSSIGGMEIENELKRRLMRPVQEHKKDPSKTFVVFQ